MRRSGAAIEGVVEARSAMSRLILRFGLLGIAQIAGSGLSFLTAVIIIRVSGAAVFGQISVGLSVLAYALLITNFGTDIAGVRMASANPERIGAMLPAIMLMRVALGGLAYVLIFLLAPLLAPSADGRAVLLILSAGVFAGAVFPAWLPQSVENIKVTALCIFGPFALTFALTSGAALIAPGGEAFAASRLAGDFVIALGVLVWARRFFDGSDWTRIQKAIGDLAGQSGFIATSELIRGLAFLSDVLIVSFFFHDSTVGHFSAAYRIYLLLVAVAAMYSIVLLPRLSRAAQQGMRELRIELGSTFLWTLPPMAALTIAFIALVPWAFPLAFGTDFSEAIPALQWLSIAASLNFVHRNYSRTLIALGLAHIDLQAKAAVTFAGILLKILGTWEWGITGTALALVAGEFILLVWLGWVTHKRLGWEAAQ